MGGDLKMKLIGLEHKQGYSQKSNKDYDFYVLHCVASSVRVNGQAAIQCNVSTKAFEDAKLNIGDEFKIFTDGEIFKF